MMVIHQQIYREGALGGTVNTTLCGRMQNTRDGMNVGNEITCKLCRRIASRKRAVEEARISRRRWFEESSGGGI